MRLRIVEDFFITQEKEAQMFNDRRMVALSLIR